MTELNEMQVRVLGRVCRFIVSRISGRYPLNELE